MRKALAFSLALLSSTLFAADDLPDEGTATDPDKQAEVPSESTAPNQMSEKQQLNDCLLRSAQTADNAVTAKEMRNWCTNGDEVKKRSVHEDALRARLALENTTQGNPFVITPHRRNYLMPYSYWSNRKWNDPTKDDSALDHTEVKFQLSLKAPIKENIVDDVTLWMASPTFLAAYTGRSPSGKQIRAGNRTQSELAVWASGFELLDLGKVNIQWKDVPAHGAGSSLQLCCRTATITGHSSRGTGYPKTKKMTRPIPAVMTIRISKNTWVTSSWKSPDRLATTWWKSWFATTCGLTTRGLAA